MTKREELKHIASLAGCVANHENGLYFINIAGKEGTTKQRLFAGTLKECMNFCYGLNAYRRYWEGKND